MVESVAMGNESVPSSQLGSGEASPALGNRSEDAAPEGVARERRTPGSVHPASLEPGNASESSKNPAPDVDTDGGPDAPGPAQDTTGASSVGSQDQVAIGTHLDHDNTVAASPSFVDMPANLGNDAQTVSPRIFEPANHTGLVFEIASHSVVARYEGSPSGAADRVKNSYTGRNGSMTLNVFDPPQTATLAIRDQDPAFVANSTASGNASRVWASTALTGPSVRTSVPYTSASHSGNGRACATPAP